MTRTTTSVLAAVAAMLYILLLAVFGDGRFTGEIWNGGAIAESVGWTYVLLALIVAAGIVQARRIGPDVIRFAPAPPPVTPGQVEGPAVWRRLLGNVYVSILWLPLRFFVGREWLESGEGKLRDGAWMDGGAALRGYWEQAVAVPEGAGGAGGAGAQDAPAGTYDWYREVLEYMLRHEWYVWFAKLIAVGETLVGLGLLVGALVGIAAFFGILMNVSFLLAGSASSNPVLLVLGILLVLAWKVAGWWGFDRWLLPGLGTPWARAEGQGAAAGPVRRVSG